jgi:5-methylcytosine-specific restriction endonuclease McrA
MKAMYRLAAMFGLHVDHIVPLKGLTKDGYPVSGLHCEANLQLLRQEVNGSKGNRMRPRDHAIVETPPTQEK